MNLYSTVIFVLILVSLHLKSEAQTDISAQVQLYPTGYIPGLKVDHSISSNGRLTLRLGANIFDHEDQGVQDNEDGDGLGFSVGYQQYLSEAFKGIYIELKNDFWWNSVDWQTDAFNGQTDVFVLQPTINLGYTLVRGSLITLSPTIGFGWEWNVSTDGEPTGEGAIGLLGMSLGIRLP